MESSVKQYLDLYGQNRDLIFGKSSDAFNSHRDRAFDNLKLTGFPSKGKENYEIIDIPEMLSPDFGINIARVPLDVNVSEGFKCGIPRLSSAIFFQLNDLWAESKGARTMLPEGVEIGPLASFMEKESSLVEKYCSLADLANPIVALNTMLVQDGIFIRVRKGVKVEKPIQIINLLDSAIPLLALRRVMVIIEEGAEAGIIACDHCASHDHPMASVSVAEIFVAKNAVLKMYSLEESMEDARRISSIYLAQEEGSNVQVESFTLHNGSTRNEFYCTFAGEHASLKLYGLGIESGSRVLDNFSYIAHNEKNCHTDELFKYVVDDSAKGAFTGRIFVAPGASGTEAYQSNRNLVGSEEARMFSKPQLEIYNDDVKCSHGSATGQLDPMQIFYMRSRGIDEVEARFLLKQAFMADIVAAVEIPLLQERLRGLIARRFEGKDASCEDCDFC